MADPPWASPCIQGRILLLVVQVVSIFFYEVSGTEMQVRNPGKSGGALGRTCNWWCLGCVWKVSGKCLVLKHKTEILESLWRATWPDLQMVVSRMCLESV